MKSAGATVVAILLLSVVPQARPVQGTASIEGIVVKAGSNQPVQGATVELTAIAPRTTEGSSEVNPGIITVSVREAETDGRVLSFTTTTGRDGKFSIRNVPATTGYQLIAINYPEYVPAQYGQRVASVPGRRSISPAVSRCEISASR